MTLVYLNKIKNENNRTCSSSIIGSSVSTSVTSEDRDR